MRALISTFLDTRVQLLARRIVADGALDVSDSATRFRAQKQFVTLPSPSPAIEKVFISANELLRDSMELAMRIVRSGFKPTFLVAIWRGGAPIGIAVQEALEYHGIHADHIAIRTSAYTGIDKQSKSVRVHAVDYLVSRLSFEDELLITSTTCSIPAAAWKL
jgi:hypothetical protein